MAIKVDMVDAVKVQGLSPLEDQKPLFDGMCPEPFVEPDIES